MPSSKSTSIRLGELLAGYDGEITYEGCDATTSIGDVAVDSRVVKSGDAFVAVVGATNDAHRFVDAVQTAGAAVVIAQRGRLETLKGPHVWLDDTAAALPTIAANRFGHPARQLQLAGITGTNGKTTTAHLVAGVLRHAGSPHIRLGTTGNWVVDREDAAGFTTPFPLELQGLLADAVSRGAKTGVMEVSSHALEQGRAKPIAYAAVGLTSFSQDHLEFHPTMEAYLEAKCRLASEYLRADGIAVAAVDGQPAASQFLSAAASPRRWRASQGAVPDAEILAHAIRDDGAGLRAQVDTPMGSIALVSPLVGDFNLDNLLVTIGLSLGLGIDTNAIEDALPSLHGAPGRLERVRATPESPVVFVDYAHTPDAVQRAIAVVRGVCRGELLVVLGCGGDRDRSKRAVMGHVASTGADRFWATSDNPRTEDPEQIIDDMLADIDGGQRHKVVRCCDRGDAIADAIGTASSNDVVLIAGKGHEDYQVLGTRRIHFDDREHALAALSQRGKKPGVSA